LNSFNGSAHHDGAQTKDGTALGSTRFPALKDVREGSAQAKPGPIGSDLTPSDYAVLEARWIDRDLADRAGLRRVDSLTGGDIVGRRSGNYAGILIPYFVPGGDSVREYRLRRDHPEMEYDSSGNLKPRQKYLSPPGRSNMLYLAPGAPQHLLRYSSIQILIAEGEFKTLALWRLAFHCAADQPRFLPLGVSGVYNWRGTIGKTTGPDGSRLDVKELDSLSHYEGDPWEEVIGPWAEERPSVSISEALQKCVQKAQALWTQTDKNRAARCLKALGWERYRERQGSRLEWRYRKEE
jgi:hypothetical protein